MRYIIAALAFTLAVLVTWLVITAMNPAQNPNGPASALSDQPFGVPFSLVDQDGAPITEEAFRGQPTALFFGFTHCPEICPTSLYEIDNWLTQLGPDGENIKAYFITIDPERDTTEVLGDYVSSVTERVRGITGDPEKVREMARGFAVFFKKVPLDDGDYTMDHTASIFLLDSEGKLRKTISYGEDSDVALQKLRDLSKT